MKRLDQYFCDMIYARTEEIGRKILYSNTRYVALVSKIIQTQQELKENLPADAQALVNCYDEAEGERDVMVMTTMYRQGFLDGISSAKIFSRL